MLSPDNATTTNSNASLRSGDDEKESILGSYKKEKGCFG
jgi:hypothetical protein